MKFVVTAGPTREFLDPVRFLSNPSTGKMGFAVAKAASQFSDNVVLVAGPVSLPTPKGVRRVNVVSARDMLSAVLSELGQEDTVYISTAAIADWRPAAKASRKLKKKEMCSTLELVRNPDILKTVWRHILKTEHKTILVGFAAETGDPLPEAARKCKEKHLAFIVANDVLAKGAGFGVDTNVASFIFPDGTTTKLPLMSKLSLAKRIVRKALEIANG